MYFLVQHVIDQDGERPECGPTLSSITLLEEMKIFWLIKDALSIFVLLTQPRRNKRRNPTLCHHQESQYSLFPRLTIGQMAPLG